MNTALDIIKEAYLKAKISYAIQQKEGYTYLVRCNDEDVVQLESMDFDKFIFYSREFLEFDPQGNVCSY